jgi:hypothetical protein
MPVDRMSGTENYRADQAVKSGGNVAAPSTSGPSVGGTENPRADGGIKSAPNKAGGPTSGQNIGPTVTGAVYKNFGGA